MTAAPDGVGTFLSGSVYPVLAEGSRSYVGYVVGGMGYDRFRAVEVYRGWQPV
ncbi:hypothetical protein BSNK01_12090 [Bacillaceae bacterium]